MKNLFLPTMKNFYYGFALFFFVLLLVFAFANFAMLAFSFFLWDFYGPAILPITWAALLGGLCGMCLMHAFHLHMKEKEDDADFM